MLRVQLGKMAPPLYGVFAQRAASYACCGVESDDHGRRQRKRGFSALGRLFFSRVSPAFLQDELPVEIGLGVHAQRVARTDLVADDAREESVSPVPDIHRVVPADAEAAVNAPEIVRLRKNHGTSRSRAMLLRVGHPHGSGVALIVVGFLVVFPPFVWEAIVHDGGPDHDGHDDRYGEGDADY